MRTKLILFFICLGGLIGCLPAREPVAVTRPMVVTALPTGTSTAVPTTNTPPPAATATQVAAATATPTTTPLPTNTPEPAWPTTPILFVRDNALHRWLPQTNEVELLVEGVNNPIYAPDIVVFMREVVPEEEYALIVFHIPTRTEVEVLRQPARELQNALSGVSTYVAPSIPITVSENGRWLAYVLQNEETSIFTLFAHKIQTSNQQIALSQKLFTRELPMRFEWPFEFLTWPTANELSWMEPSGIWIANLETTPITIGLGIFASTNTVLVPPMNPDEQDKGSIPFQTIYIPYQWSPNGRFLLAIENFPGELGDVFQIIERDTNLAFQLPDSALGPLSDNAVWLDETRILHYRMDGMVRIWQIRSGDEQFLADEFHAAPPGENLFQVTNLFPLPTNHVRVEDPFLGIFYDLDLATQKLAVIGEIKNETGYREHVWSPNAQHALWIIQNFLDGDLTKSVRLDFLNGQPPADMSQIFGLDSCCWYWENSGSE